jgi:hypothetical protein
LAAAAEADGMDTPFGNQESRKVGSESRKVGSGLDLSLPHYGLVSLVGWKECHECQRWVELISTQPTLLLYQ